MSAKWRGGGGQMLDTGGLRTAHQAYFQGNAGPLRDIIVKLEALSESGVTKLRHRSGLEQ